MSVPAREYEGKIAAQQAERLYSNIHDDLKGTISSASALTTTDVKRIVTYAVSSSKSADFEKKVIGEFTGLTGAVGKLVGLHPQILKRIKEHASSAASQSSMSHFGLRERVEGGGISKGGLIRPAGVARP
eukprot:CAMPEP_0113712432 /NCGR_PEP_ID=MMETSP0038_2-20120614/31384_1 /TAXON_ID=2898 /ORGANISM="Cryptomonas paramecium" /LENGTH=129 /DNA_ID=CAMNT_0000638949 /DNA_START=89 /DNA_END=475 /DNA_ORIENTATION=+ /assembly_acc=CAM_ASM_000170